MKFLITGLNHRGAPVELREKVAMNGEELPRALRALRGWPYVREAMILSTCNRVELLVACGEETPDLMSFLTEHFPVSEAELCGHLHEYQGTDAVRHLFRIASSLDSMVVGEPQILGQVKEAFAAARAAEALGSGLEGLVQRALGVAKRVRTETSIGSSSVSIASVAVDLALRIFGSLAGKRVLLVGAGKMGELAARHLMDKGAGSISVTNRTPARAERLAQLFDGRVLPYENLLEHADQADILITSTGAHEFVFRREDGVGFVQRRRNRPMFFIDIAVPRDVDPEMNRVDGVFVYDIDDLQGVAAANMADRSREAASAERLVQVEVEEFARRGQVLDAAPTLVALREKTEAMRQAEIGRAPGLQELTLAQMEAVEALTRRMANKFLHAPLQALRAAAHEGDRERLSLLREAFQLPEAGLGQVCKGNHRHEAPAAEVETADLAERR